MIVSRSGTPMRFSRALLAILIATSLVGISTHVNAQTVLARVLDGEDSRPVFGALTYLVDSEGTVLKNALTDQEGSDRVADQLTKCAGHARSSFSVPKIIHEQGRQPRSPGIRSRVLASEPYSDYPPGRFGGNRTRWTPSEVCSVRAISAPPSRPDWEAPSPRPGSASHVGKYPFPPRTVPSNNRPRQARGLPS